MHPETRIDSGTRLRRDRPPLVLIPQHFGCLVFDRRSSRYMPFDEESTRLLRDCVDRPFGNVLESFPRERHSDLIDFFDYFYDRGFFTFDGRLAGERLELNPPADHLAGPLAVHLEVIGACNLTCTHCFAGELPRHQNPLTLREMEGLFAEFSAMGAFRLGLTGGEPLMRKDLFEIIDAATDHGLHPCLTTNGLLIDEAIAREFGRRDLVWLNVSLDGATAETNDSIRGDGTFEKVLRKLEILGRHAPFTIAFTITRTNVDEIEKCAQLARDVGAHTAVFRPLYPVGVAQEHMELMPTFEQYSGALNRLTGAVIAGGDLHGIDPFSPQARDQAQAKTHTNNGCGAGNLIASISVQGEVNPCSFLGSTFNAANVRDESFAQIWHHSQGFTSMRSLSRDDGCGACGDDPFRGGCRARSLAFKGDVDRADPWHDAYLVQIGGTAEKRVTDSHARPSHPMANIDLDPVDHGA